MTISLGKGQHMPRIVITHAVQDVDRWLKGKAERAAALPGAAEVTDLERRSSSGVGVGFGLVTG